MKYVLFVCTHNAGRSQMAQAFFERECTHDCRSESAGSDPARQLWPEVVEVMREVGIDISDRKPKRLSATAAGLFAIILMFGSVSGAHFNPVVSLVDASFRGITWRDAGAYAAAQISGCVTGAVVATGMFARAAVSISTKHRASPAHLLAEVVATLGLLLLIFSLARTRRGAAAPAAVGAYIGAAYFFTSSTSFANPAISIGRMFSATFAGIAPSSVPAYVVAQLCGAAVSVAAIRVLYPDVTPADAAEVVLPHPRRAARADARGFAGTEDPATESA